MDLTPPKHALVGVSSYRDWYDLMMAVDPSPEER